VPSDEPDAEQDAVLAANAAFYDAFEAGDMDRMSDVWEHSDRVVCTHPGWSTLQGWAAISASWFALFSNGQHLQFIVTNAVAEVVGEAAWVHCDENILDSGDGGTVAALNVFTRERGAWRMVAHHGSPVMQRG
jgi:ketosteroid isomerase-like protein